MMRISCERLRRCRSGLAPILVISARPLVMQITAFTLQYAGWNVASARDADAAITMLDTLDGKPSGIVCDLGEGTLDGTELAAALRARPGFEATPILVLGDPLDEAHRHEARTAGATGWVAKPFDPENLLWAIDETVRREPIDRAFIVPCARLKLQLTGH